MAEKCEIRFLVAYVCLIPGYFFRVSLSNETQMLSPLTDTTPSNGSYSLSFQGTKPLTWTTLEVEEGGVSEKNYGRSKTNILKANISDGSGEKQSTTTGSAVHITRFMKPRRTNDNETVEDGDVTVFHTVTEDSPTSTLPLDREDENFVVARIINNPKILPPYDDVIQPNSNYTVFCQGIKPLRWTIPDVSGDKQYWTRFIIEPEIPNDERYQYGSRLSIVNMTYPFGGFYYCHHEDVDKSDKHSSNIQLLVTPSPTMRRPQILSEYETTIEPNSNYSVFCQGTKPLAWSTPILDESIVLDVDFTKFVIKSETPVSDVHEYGSRLYIVNMTYLYVGFYYCHHEDASKLSEFESSNVYLYVNDTNNLHVLSINASVIQTDQGELIPCRPTSPDVYVKLYYTFVKQEETFIYDPKVGFIRGNTSVTYQCTFTRNLKVDQIDGMLWSEDEDVDPLPLIDIQDGSDGHTVVGQSLILTCSIHTDDLVNFIWTTPHGPVDPLSERIKISRKVNTNTRRTYEIMYHQSLVVYNVTLEDRGTYYCNVTGSDNDSSHDDINVNIFGADEYFVNISKINNSPTVYAVRGQPYAQFMAIVQGHPKPTIMWLKDEDNLIGENYERHFDTRNNVAFLKINNITDADGGLYKLTASNNKTETTLKFILDVIANPTVEIENGSLVSLANTPITIKCTEYAYPLMKLQWKYQPCLSYDCNFLPLEGTIFKNDSFELTSQVTFVPSQSGLITCFARSFKSSSYDDANLYLSDVKDGFDVFGLDNTIDLDQEKMVATLAHLEPITLTCGALVAFFTDIVWLFRGQILQDGDKYKLTKNNTQYSNTLRLEIPHANYSDSGLYSCKARHIKLGEEPNKAAVSSDDDDEDEEEDDEHPEYDFNQIYGNKVAYEDTDYKYVFSNISFNVIDPQPPNILFTNMETKIEINLPDRLEIICNASGVPKPTVTWYKDETLFRPSESKRIQVHENNERIVILSTEVEDEGTYKCEARNKFGIKHRQQFVKFKNIPRNLEWVIYPVIFLILLFLAAVLIVVLKIRKEKKFQRELKKLGLANFVKGAVNHINPDLSIEDQAELLPYDQKWEFPIYNLKLGKQLGCGEFGIVMIGQAKNIIKEEKLTTVAIKVVKKSADARCIKALASELKIMIYLGKHLNLVNLLGACTKNIARRELLVIVEYCRFGCLQNYLRRQRDNFIDQVDPETGKILYTTNGEHSDNTSVLGDRSSSEHHAGAVQPAKNMEDCKENVQNGVTKDPTESHEEGYITVNRSGDSMCNYKRRIKNIYTKDLLVWALQVAKGMEYLASRKVLHGDLAARNVLLSDYNIVKICDFGLAKCIYKYGKYKKLSDGPLPVKWMAIESIRDNIFSTQSDVWSFGIVLWEFFSLGRTPYPGKDIAENFCKRLEDGYRMESPKHAPKQIYELMRNCWAPTPHSRPSFTELSQKIGDLLEVSERKHYLDLNNTYQMQNSQRLESGETDCLGMLRPSTYDARRTSFEDVDGSTGRVSLELSDYSPIQLSDVLIPKVDEISKL